MNTENHKPAVKLLTTIIVVIILGILLSLNIIPSRQYTDADFGIKKYHSSIDKDDDGIDDQTDILMSVREYLSTKPKYQSKYYDGGYPDDEYGVCTDVVALALKGAGYDLMTLVDEDIKANPEAYDVDIRDKNIDFRRVKNLAVWFRRNTQALTTNVKDYAEWQGGDIVIFEDHIGIVSDRRNKNGIPYLIHHYSPIQMTYEEDILKDYQGKVIGHYRAS